MKQPEMSEITPSQTVGPFFAYGLAPHSRCEWRPEQGKDVYDWKNTANANLVTADTSGTKIRIEGRVLDGDGMPINDAMLEIWQADAQGRYAHPADNRPRPNTQVHGLRPFGDRQERRLQFRYYKARTGSGAERQGTGAAYCLLHFLARHAAADLHPPLFPR